MIVLAMTTTDRLTAIGAAIAIPGALVAFRQLRRRVKVVASYDRTGLVQAIITKKGSGPVHVRRVAVMQPGTKTLLGIVSSQPAGPFDMNGDSGASYDVFILVASADVASGVTV